MYDRILFWLMLGLIATGFIMVTSSSISVGQRLSGDAFLFAKRDILYIFLSFCLASAVLILPIRFWQLYSNTILIVSIILLLIIPIIGITVNGSSRWIKLGSLHIQPVEFTKLSFFCYLASYLERKFDELHRNINGFLKPIGMILVLSIPLLAQPDFGNILILFFTTLVILFLAGMKFWHFIATVITGILAIIILIFSKPYRINRIISFWNPWVDPFGSGYQLTQSLMAFGRGKIFGQGLGNSVQKMEYLPEAHTDFILSIIGEELGYVGVTLILLMVFSIAIRAMYIGKIALENNNYFSGFLACSIGIWFSFQTLVNVGATIGVLPIKGLTLPLISYGGSSLLIMLTAIMMLLRIDYEMRLKKYQAFMRGSK